MGAPLRRDERFIGRTAQGRGTDELMRLIDNCADVEEMMSDIESDLVDKSFSLRLAELMESRGMRAAELAKMSLMSRSFVYQICAGDREPGRDVVLRLALMLKAGVPETQRLLRSAGRGALYPRIRRDAVLLYALKEGLDVFTADELLAGCGEEPLIVAQ